MSSLANLPYLPIALGALQENPLFLSSNARLVRASLWMLEAAWRSNVPGSIPSSFGSLAMVTRLSEAEVQLHYADLTTGWELRDDGRLHHEDLSRLANSIDDQFGSQLDVLANGMAIAMQGVEAFELLPTEAVKKASKNRVKRGKAEIPNTFEPDATSLASLIKAGFVTEEYRQWLLEQFQDYAKSKGLKQANWQATLRTYASSSITANAFRARFRMFPSETSVALVPTSTSPLDRLRGAGIAASPSFAQRTAAHNSNVMSVAMSGRSQYAGRADSDFVEASP